MQSTICEWYLRSRSIILLHLKTLKIWSFLMWSHFRRERAVGTSRPVKVEYCKICERITFWGRHEESIWLKVTLTPFCPLLSNTCLAEILRNLRILQRRGGILSRPYRLFRSSKYFTPLWILMSTRSPRCKPPAKKMVFILTWYFGKLKPGVKGFLESLST